jgi:hypothetical protein
MLSTRKLTTEGPGLVIPLVRGVGSLVEPAVLLGCSVVLGPV